MYRVKEGILGGAIADALGIVTKGQDREYLLNNPVLKMLPTVKKGIPKGAWGDSTSLMLATTYSISRKGLNYDYIAENCVSWFTGNKFCSAGESFGIGNTTLKALIKFTEREKESYECGLDSFDNNGNSALKMMLPLAYYFTANKETKEQVYDAIKKVCSITHKHPISICACYIYVHFVMYILNGNNKHQALKKLKNLDYSMFSNEVLGYFSRILVGNIIELEIEEINSSSFIVDTLESILWCFMQSDNFKDCIIATTNIGNDTSSIGALTGSIAGIYYGTNNIPTNWMESVRRKDYLISLSEEFEKYLRLLSYNEHL